MLPAVAIDALVDHVEAACDAQAVQVEVLGVAEAALAEAEAVRWEGDPCARRPTLRLELLADGRVAARYTVRPLLSGHALGPVATVDLSPGDPVQWAPGPVPLGVPTLDADSLPAAGLATRTLAAGTPLTPGTVRSAPDVAEGAAVTVVVRRGALQLTVPGTLLRDGAIGAPVRVRNDLNRTALSGVLVAADRVEIR